MRRIVRLALSAIRARLSSGRFRQPSLDFPRDTMQFCLLQNTTLYRDRRRPRGSFFGEHPAVRLREVVDSSRDE